MIETTFNKVYPEKEVNVLLVNQLEPFAKQNKPFERRKRFRRSTIVYNVINYIVKNVYLINDEYDINKKME